MATWMHRAVVRRTEIRLSGIASLGLARGGVNTLLFSFVVLIPACQQRGKKMYWETDFMYPECELFAICLRLFLSCFAFISGSSEIPEQSQKYA